MLASREEVDRLRDLAQETAWWLKNHGPPVKAGLLRRQLGRFPKLTRAYPSSSGARCLLFCFYAVDGYEGPSQDRRKILLQSYTCWARRRNA